MLNAANTGKMLASQGSIKPPQTHAVSDPSLR